MINIKDPAKCCGCSACASICAQGAITMQPDALGFLYPVVDAKRCTNCGLCEKVCSFNEHYDRSMNLPEPDTYGARHKDTDEVMKSRSGAVFAAISNYILKQGGVIYGAGYKDHFRVCHKRATTPEERDELRGSKYVQSDMRGIYEQVKQDLKQGLTVLFSGTPCQTSAVRAYLGNKLCENLVLIDVVCHGVPSPYIWQDLLKHIEQKHGGQITWVNFRDKATYGWADHCESYKVCKNGLENLVH